MNSATAIDEKIFDCWMHGVGIGETIAAVKRTLGEDVSFEDVRLRFVTAAERFAGAPA